MALRWRVIFAAAVVLAALGEVRADGDSLAYPQLFRGKITVYFPFAAVPKDTTGHNFFWLPVPEMGFQFTPIIKFKSGRGWWEFPVHIMTFFPFLDRYAALGDVSVGAGFAAPPSYRMGIYYRFMAGSFYPVDGRFSGHIAGADISIPIKGLSVGGAKLDWVIFFKFDMHKTFVSTKKVYDHYEGSVFSIAPYWRFPLKYGTITLAYRVVLPSNLTGADTGKNNTYTVRTHTFSMIEFEYIYP